LVNPVGKRQLAKTATHILTIKMPKATENNAPNSEFLGGHCLSVKNRDYPGQLHQKAEHSNIKQKQEHA
jgi:hypothetical protein